MDLQLTDLTLAPDAIDVTITGTGRGSTNVSVTKAQLVSAVSGVLRRFPNVLEQAAHGFVNLTPTDDRGRGYRDTPLLGMQAEMVRLLTIDALDTASLADLRAVKPSLSLAGKGGAFLLRIGGNATGIDSLLGLKVEGAGEDLSASERTIDLEPWYINPRGFLQGMPNQGFEGCAYPIEALHDSPLCGDSPRSRIKASLAALIPSNDDGSNPIIGLLTGSSVEQVLGKQIGLAITQAGALLEKPSPNLRSVRDMLDTVLRSDGAVVILADDATPMPLRGIGMQLRTRLTDIREAVVTIMRAE